MPSAGPTSCRYTVTCDVRHHAQHVYTRRQMHASTGGETSWVVAGRTMDTTHRTITMRTAVARARTLIMPGWFSVLEYVETIVSASQPSCSIGSAQSRGAPHSAVAKLRPMHMCKNDRSPSKISHHRVTYPLCHLHVCIWWKLRRVVAVACQHMSLDLPRHMVCSRHSVSPNGWSRGDMNGGVVVFEPPHTSSSV